MKKEYRRPILAELHRKKGRSTQILWRRFYLRIDRAFPKAVELLLLKGEPGDVIQFSHADYGFEIGTIKLHVHGKISIDWTIAKESKIVPYPNKRKRA